MNNNTDNLFLVIPVHDRINFTIACLESLSKQTVKGFHIIIIDDGSTDGTGECIRENFLDVIILRGDGNLWWTAATNRGVEYALRHEAEYIMTLNNDTLPLPDFIEKMLFWAAKMPNALLGALALDAETKEVVYGGEIINWKTGKFPPLTTERDGENLHGLHIVTHFPGRGLLIPADVFRKIGLYDQKHFPHYAADYDFTHRAARAGYKILCNYDAKLLIYPDASNSVKMRKNKCMKNYLTHLFGINGGGNLLVFTFYAIHNCPTQYLIPFWVQGFIRRVIGYWIH